MIVIIIQVGGSDLQLKDGAEADCGCGYDDSGTRRRTKIKLKDGDEAGYDCDYELMIQERGAKPIGRKGSPIEHVGSGRDRSRIRSSSGHPVHAQIYQVSVVVVVIFVVIVVIFVRGGFIRHGLWDSSRVQSVCLCVCLSVSVSTIKIL